MIRIKNIIFCLVLTIFLLSCTQKPDINSISKAIEDANYCSQDSDCSALTFDCPFGCPNLVNKNTDPAKINKMITDLYGGPGVCNKACIRPSESIACEQNKCVAKKIAECNMDSDCVKAGCSSQLCVPVSKKSTITTCEFRPEYDCLKLTTCSCKSGKCNWIDNSEYQACLNKITG